MLTCSAVLKPYNRINSLPKKEKFFMKKYTWNSEKNENLIRNRNISFEKIVFHIKNEDEIDVYEHPNQLKYPGQKISVIKIHNYAFLVPFIETKDEILLKTIIPNRKATKKYLRGKNE